MFPQRYNVSVGIECYVELSKIYRQSDKTFINLLQDMRYGIVTKENEQRLRSRISKDFMQMADVQFINGKQISKEQLKKEAEAKGKQYYFNALCLSFSVTLHIFSNIYFYIL
jgi:hypothetical protein